jgi:hypothetical protein
MAPAETYHQVVNGRLVRVRPSAGAAVPLARLLHGQVSALLEGQGARLGPQLSRLTVTGLGIYPALASRPAIRGCATDLRELGAAGWPGGGTPRPALAAVFDAPVSPSEAAFAARLRRQLAGMRGSQPGRGHPGSVLWIGGRGFHVIAFHPAAADWAYRFSWPTLVFFPAAIENGR